MTSNPHPTTAALVEAADGLDLVANALREVHALSADCDKKYDGHMMGQIAAVERGASLLRSLALAQSKAEPSDATKRMATTLGAEWVPNEPLVTDTLIEDAVQAALDAGVAVNGEHGVAAARVAARYVAARLSAPAPVMVSEAARVNLGVTLHQHKHGVIDTLVAIDAIVEIARLAAIQSSSLAQGGQHVHR